MEFGVMLPQIDVGWEQTRAFARRAEELGFDSVWVVDHVYGIMPGTGITECLTTMAAVVASTESIDVGSLVVCQSMRNPALLAKSLATIEHIAPGRLRVLLGAGYVPEEYESFGYDYPPGRVRLEQLDEVTTIVRSLLNPDVGPLTFEGQHHRTADARLRPAPSRPIPVGIGGHQDLLLDLAARTADEWNCPHGEDFFATKGKLDRRVALRGRRVRVSASALFDPAGIVDPELLEVMHVPEERRTILETPNLRGSAADMADTVAGLASVGVDAVYGMTFDPDALDVMGGRLPELRRSAEEAVDEGP